MGPDRRGRVSEVPLSLGLPSRRAQSFSSPDSPAPGGVWAEVGTSGAGRNKDQVCGGCRENSP